MRLASVVAVALALFCAPPRLAWAEMPDLRVVEAEITGTPFKKYLTYQTYQVSLSDGQVLTGGFVFGPGHHISGMAALVFDPKLTPYATFKTGDTRLARAMRGEPYVAVNGIAGRWDKAGYSAGNIVLAELAEEVGGSVVPGTFRRLGDQLAPTMPFESSEADEWFLAAVELGGKAFGDGGEMEVLDLIGPVFLSPEEAIMALDEGRISDSARARAMFGRAWSAIGYLPALDLYAQDIPALSQRYDTLGLGPVEEIRPRTHGQGLPSPRRRADTFRAGINTVVVDKSATVSLTPHEDLIDARIQHAVREESGKTTVLAPDFASEYLRVDYDRAKVAVYFLDPEKGPMVEMVPQARPVLSFAPKSPAVVRRDLRDVKVGKERVRRPQTAPDGDFIRSSGVMRFLAKELPGTPRQLSFPSAASSGQSDLYYHNVACEVDPPDALSRTHFVTLAEAIRLCRQGHGDAQTEATLLRLADHLGWIPELGTGVSQARRMAKKVRS